MPLNGQSFAKLVGDNTLGLEFVVKFGLLSQLVKFGGQLGIYIKYFLCKKIIFMLQDNSE